jgi:glutamate dehydrogenase
MDTELRLRIQDILVAAFNGSLSAYYPEITDAPLARLHLIIKTPSGTPERMDFVALEHKVEHATRSWHDRLKRMLPSELGEERGALLAERYGHAFPASYREDFDDIVAVSDIEYIEHAISENKLTLQLYRAVDAPEQELRFKIFSPNGYVALSDVHPILENLGLRVLGEVPYELHVKGLSRPIWLHDFGMLVEGDVPAETPQLRDAFTAVFSATWEKRMDDDGFNKLVLHAGLSARQVVLLRACAKYLRQIQVPFSEGYMQQTLRKNPKITRALVELFESRFDPVHSSVERCEQLRAELLANLDAVVSLDEDRILRLFLDLIEATTRTNFFQVDEHGAPRDHLAFKIESGRMPAVPRPAPFREIFVSGPRTEGVHLRFGEVARGGLRWSDRLEDFRTEILGLAKAQQVKNAVIVPVGSKGGFVVKRPPPANAGRDALIAEGIACYEIFIESLLDLTDNRRWNVASDRSGQARPEDLPPTDEIVPPDNTVRHDPPDPYLVVAADKGTATFSDIANAISQRRNFWLDDAFASGGSEGYDHKQMGITARGAWESIKRHFRELDKNIQTQPFTCAGVGDMSGDVFGNGLLLSQQTRLIAAFDHRHIFLDPTPNVELSWKERSRLFQLSRSSWDDYNRELILREAAFTPDPPSALSFRQKCAQASASTRWCSPPAS